MTRLLLAISLFAATGLESAYCQVEYQHFDGFSVISEPLPMPEAKSQGPARMDEIVILRDSNPKEEPAGKQTCKFLDTNTSLTWQTADSIPIMYVYRKCGGTIEMTYRDLSGREWKQPQLIPLQRETFIKTLSEFAGSDGVRSSEDAQGRIATYAICKGVVPKPDWFHDVCEQQTQVNAP